MKRILLLILLMPTLFFAQTPISSTIPFQGYSESQAHNGQGEYQIFLDNVNGVLDKPVFIVDGFDPTDTRDLAAMYAMLSDGNSNFADTLRDEGFDFVFLNFPVYTRTSDNTEIDGGVDYIQRNAMVLTELIEQINNLKVGTEENVVIGPSMGGLISRYALRYMEQNSLNHETRLYISWDTPHLGANIPIGFQYLMNTTGEILADSGDSSVRDAIQPLLNNPASKQMLIDHYLGHLDSNSTYEQDPSILLATGAPNYRTAFQTELDAMGFPQNTRNISITNGSGNGTTTGTAGMNVIDYTINNPVANVHSIEIDLNFTPSAGQTNIVTDLTVNASVFGVPVPILNFTADSQSSAASDGLDSAPGGKYDISVLNNLGQTNALLADIMNNLNQDEFCFIPTVSAMAIDSQTDWHATANTANSPFDAWSIPTVNEFHVTPNAQNVQFTLNEIRNGVANINDNTLANSITLKTNPVKDHITLLISNDQDIKNLDIQLANINGQVVWNRTNMPISNEINIPVNIPNGVYFLTAQNNHSSFNSKVIINK